MIMLKKQFFIFSMLLIFLIKPAFSDNTVTNYKATFRPLFTKDGEMRLAIRFFSLNNVYSFLLVNPYTLETSIQPVADLTTSNVSHMGNGYISWEEIATTPYRTLLDRFSVPPFQQANYGYTHSLKNVRGYFMTADLCPSSKPLEKKFFEDLGNLSAKNNAPTPVAIAISGIRYASRDLYSRVAPGLRFL